MFYLKSGFDSDESAFIRSYEDPFRFADNQSGFSLSRNNDMLLDLDSCSSLNNSVCGNSCKTSKADCSVNTNRYRANLSTKVNSLNASNSPTSGKSSEISTEPSCSNEAMSIDRSVQDNNTDGIPHSGEEDVLFISDDARGHLDGISQQPLNRCFDDQGKWFSGRKGDDSLKVFKQFNDISEGSYPIDNKTSYVDCRLIPLADVSSERSRSYSNVNFPSHCANQQRYTAGEVDVNKRGSGEDHLCDNTYVPDNLFSKLSGINDSCYFVSQNRRNSGEMISEGHFYSPIHRSSSLTRYSIDEREHDNKYISTSLQTDCHQLCSDATPFFTFSFPRESRLARYDVSAHSDQQNRYNNRDISSIYRDHVTVPDYSTSRSIDFNSRGYDTMVSRADDLFTPLDYELQQNSRKLSPDVYFSCDTANLNGGIPPSTTKSSRAVSVSARTRFCRTGVSSIIPGCFSHNYESRCASHERCQIKPHSPYALPPGENNPDAQPGAHLCYDYINKRTCERQRQGLSCHFRHLDANHPDVIADRYKNNMLTPKEVLRYGLRPCDEGETNPFATRDAKICFDFLNKHVCSRTAAMKICRYRHLLSFHPDAITDKRKDRQISV